eukprot:scaffold10260_cov266-Chaetoceros_neogracile.AAC.61
MPCVARERSLVTEVGAIRIVRFDDDLLPNEIFVEVSPLRNIFARGGMYLHYPPCSLPSLVFASSSSHAHANSPSTPIRTNTLGFTLGIPIG